MTLLRVYPVLSRALVLLAILAACMALDAILVLLIAGGLAAGSGLVTDGPRGIHLRRGSSLALSGLALAVTTAWAVMHPDQAVSSISQFAVWLTVIKMYERHTLENEAERLVLSVLLIALGAMRGLDLLFGVVLVAWVILAIIVLLLFQLQVGRGEFIDMNEVGPRRRVDPVAGQGVRRHFRRAVTIIVSMALLISAGLFLAFPRGISPGLSDAAAARLTRTGSGMRDEVELVTGTRIVATNGLVAEVEVSGDTSEVIQSNRLYLRTGTSSLYRGNGLWSPRHRGYERLVWCEPDAWTTLQAKPGGDADEKTATVRMTMHSDLEYLPIPRGVVRLNPDRALQFEWVPTREVARMFDTEPRVISFVVDGSPVPATGGFPQQSIRPDGVATLAVELLEAAAISPSAPADPMDRPAWRGAAVQVFLSHLRGPRFSYSLDLSRVGSDPEFKDLDPIERFLIHEPIGHCEYFAASIVSLCQSVGIDSRIVKGFLATPHADDLWMVLDRDAHAWAEVRLEPSTWTRVDPTAARRLSVVAGEEGLLAQLTWWVRMADSRWRLYVLGFDGSIQQHVADRVLPGVNSAISATRSGVGRLLERLDLLFGLGRAGTIWLFSVLVIMATGLTVFIRLRRRRGRFLNRIGLGDGRVNPKDVAFYADFLEVLRRADLSKPEHCPPLTWCDTIDGVNVQAGSVARRLVRRFYALRYGRGARGDDPATGDELARLAAALGVRR